MSEFISSRQMAVHNAVQLLQEQCHLASFRAGWWTAKDGSHLRDNPLMFSNKLALCHSELSEALEGDRKSAMDDKLTHRPQREVELVDALVRIFDLAGAYEMDLAGAMIDKMAFNAKRADHKPEARNAPGGKSY